ncbi:hypothetical protein BU17DRAFT_79418 [Hysterangium stoloniferum]|nr:hypothetical protein BU17DRAFT_79418 [Hysterangium stoloniferum]
MPEEVEKPPPTLLTAMPPTSLMPQNAFSSIEIEGLLKKNDQNVMLTCERGASIPTNPLYDGSGRVRPDGFWVRPPSKLPAPGNGTLRVIVKDQLGQGRVGTVYSVNIVSPEEGPHIPPLVIKVSDRYRSAKLAREAWFYEEMEHLQGVSIGRCYGFFQVELTEECEVPNWRKISEESAEEADEEERCSLRDSVWSRESVRYNAVIGQEEVIDSWKEYEEQEEDRNRREAAFFTPNPAAHLTFVRKHHLISVLVLEQLGDHLPVGVTLEGIEYVLQLFRYRINHLIRFRQDVYDLHEDLGMLGIEAVDVHWRNILEASDTSEKLVCPYHGYQHNWRLIDFDLAEKTDRPMKQAAKTAHSFLETIFRNLVEGIIVGWD